ncbi:hypothetical protein SSTU70S_03260 [Stutzerimonas stutzeri]
MAVVRLAKRRHSHDQTMLLGCARSQRLAELGGLFAAGFIRLCEQSREKQMVQNVPPLIQRARRRLQQQRSHRIQAKAAAQRVTVARRLGQPYPVLVSLLRLCCLRIMERCNPRPLSLARLQLRQQAKQLIENISSSGKPGRGLRRFPVPPKRRRCPDPPAKCTLLQDCFCGLTHPQVCPSRMGAAKGYGTPLPRLVAMGPA